MQELNLEPEYSPSGVLPEPPIKEYPGIRRLGYFLGMMGLATLNVLLTPESRFGNQPSAVIGFIILGIALTLVVERLRNIGMSGWWALLSLVPIANIWIGFKCLIAQEGYNDAKELDSTGKLLNAIVVVCLVLMLATILIMIASLFLR